MKKYKVIQYDFYNFGDPDLDLSSEGYEAVADLVVKVKEEGTNNSYEMTFPDVYTFTYISNYREDPGSRWEEPWTDWDDEETYLMDGSEELYVEEVKTLSGEDLTDDEPTEEEQDYILQQIPYMERHQGKRFYLPR